MGCDFFCNTAGSGISSFARLSVRRIPNVGLFVNSDANGVLISGVRSLGHIFGATGSLGLPIVARYRSARVVGHGVTRTGTGCKRSPTIRRRPRVHDRRTYCRDDGLTIRLTHRFNAHLRVTRIAATQRLRLFTRRGKGTGRCSKSNVPLPRVAKRTIVTRLIFSSTSCTAGGTLVGYGPTVGALTSHSTLHGTLDSKAVTAVNASRTPRR